MTYVHFDRSWRLIYRDAEFVLSRRDGEALEFDDVKAGRLLRLTDDELMAAVEEDVARIVREGLVYDPETMRERVVEDVSILSEGERWEADRRAAYVNAFVDAGLVSRPDNEKATGLIASVAQDRGEKAPSLRSVQRWRKRTAGCRAVMGRMATRNRDKGNRNGRLDPEVRLLIGQMIETKYLCRPPISVDSLLSKIRYRINGINKGREAPLLYPGEGAVRSMIGRYDQAAVMEARYGTARAFSLYGDAAEQPEPEAPLDLVEIDHTTADLFVVDDLTGAPLGRPTICSAIDRCTRMPWGLHVSFDPPSTLTVMQTLKNGILRKTYVQKMIAEVGLEIQNEWDAFGVPHMLMCDRAMENVGHDLSALAAELPIKIVRFAPGRTPWHKGAIERFLGTLNRTLLQEQRGTSFSNVFERDGYDAERQAVITLGRLRALIHMFLIDVYARRQHRGLRGVPSVRWKEMTRIHPVEPIDAIEQLSGLFGAIEHRTVRRSGITFMNITYTSPALIKLRRSKKFVDSLPIVDGKRRVTFRYDPSDMGSILVHIPHLREHWRIEASPRYRNYARGLSVWAHRHICRCITTKAREISIEELDAARARITAAVEDMLPAGTLIGGRKKGARFIQIGSQAMAGDSVRTTPEGSFHDRRVIGVELPSKVSKSRTAEKATVKSTGLPLQPMPSPTDLAQSTPMRSGAILVSEADFLDEEDAFRDADEQDMENDTDGLEGLDSDKPESKSAASQMVIREVGGSLIVSESGFEDEED